MLETRAFDGRGKLFHEARSILDRADRERREPTAEENDRFDRLVDHATAMKPNVAFHSQNRQRPTRRAANGRRGTEEYRAAFNRFLVHGVGGLSASEQRALQSDDDAGGGYLVAGEQFAEELIKELNDTLWIRQIARVIPVEGAGSLGAPKRTAKANTFGWGGEIEAATPDTALKLGKRQLYPHYLSGEIRVSRDLLQNAALDADEIVRDEMAENAGEVQEKAFLNGHGSGQPLGVFTASELGISIGRDVSADNTTTAPTFDGLINAKFSLKQTHLKNAVWLFHRDVVKVIAKIKDGEGRYLWTESTRVDEPDRLLGKPVLMSEFAPNTLTTGLYVGILGDFQRYWIAEHVLVEIQVLLELYAATNEVGYLGRLKIDGAPILEEAFARVKLA